MAYNMKYTKSAVKKTGTPFPFKESPLHVEPITTALITAGVGAALSAGTTAIAKAKKRKEDKKAIAEAKATEATTTSSEGINEGVDPQTGKTNLLAE